MLCSVAAFAVLAVAGVASDRSTAHAPLPLCSPQLSVNCNGTLKHGLSYTLSPRSSYRHSTYADTNTDTNTDTYVDTYVDTYAVWVNLIARDV